MKVDSKAAEAYFLHCVRLEEQLGIALSDKDVSLENVKRLTALVAEAWARLEGMTR